MNNCYLCNALQKGVLEEHSDFSVTNIVCDKCKIFWCSLENFLDARTKKTSEDSSLNATQKVHAGDKIWCPTCGKKWHELLPIKNSKGETSELLLTYKCGDKLRIAAIENKLVLRWCRSSGINKWKYAFATTWRNKEE